MGEIEIRRTKPHANASVRARRANRCIGELLLELGVAPHTAGFSALRSGTMLLTEQGNAFRQRLNDTLYPIVERYAGNERRSAEHAIRDTVRISWQREANALRSELLSDDCVPTNAEILYALAAYAKERIEEWDRV